MQFIYLIKQDIVDSNKAVINVFGGNFVPPSNLLKEAPLDYLVEVVEHGMLFGEHIYPTIHAKAALYLYNICQNHIFTDGNKRTGLDIMLIFLNLNGYDLKEELDVLILENKKTIPSISNNNISAETILEQFILDVASSKVSHEEITAWLNLNTEQIQNPAI